MKRLAAGLALALAACGSDAPVDNASAGVVVPTPAASALPTAPTIPDAPGALPAPELDGARGVAGAWRLQASASGAAALFEANGSEAIFAVRCEPQTREVVLVRHGVTGGSLRIVTRSAAATYPARPGGEAMPATLARVAADDSFLTALGAVRGRMAVLVDSDAALALPGDPAVARVIESCRAPGG